MDQINLNSSSSAKNSTDSEIVDNLNWGIMNMLLEKYKPKSLCNIKTIQNRNDKITLSYDYE